MEYSKEISYALKKLKQITGMTMDVVIENEQDEKKALTQIKRLCQAYQEKYSQTHFLQNLLCSSVPLSELNQEAAYFHIDVWQTRVLFLLRAKEPFDEIVLEILKNLFPVKTKVYTVPLNDTDIAVLYPLDIGTLSADSTAVREEILLTAHTIIDTLSAEAMSSIKIAYSEMFEKLGDCQVAYQNAVLALKIGNLFYSERKVFSYYNLGLGKLISRIPISSCEEFLTEIFGQGVHEIDSELEQTARTFIKHNLNIAEASRQLHMHRNTLIYRLDQVEKQTGLNIRNFEDAMTFEVACMIMNYLKFPQK